MNREFENIISEIRNSDFDKEEFIRWLFNDTNDNTTKNFSCKLLETYKKIVNANAKTMNCARLKRSPNNNYGYIYDNFETSKIDFIVDNDDLSYFEIDFIIITLILITNNILVVGENKDYPKAIPTQKNEILLNYCTHL